MGDEEKVRGLILNISVQVLAPPIWVTWRRSLIPKPQAQSLKTAKNRMSFTARL